MAEAKNPVRLKSDGLPIDEFDVRQWFLKADFSEAYQTYHIVGGIMEARELSQPKKKQRSDAGTKRKPKEDQPQQQLPGVGQ